MQMAISLTGAHQSVRANADHVINIHESSRSIIFGAFYTVLSRDATIQFFQNRSDTANSEDRPIPIQSDTSAGVFFFFLCNLEFLYFSVLTRSSLFCVLNTIYYSVSQLVCQKCWVCSVTVLKGSRIVYSQRNDINKKTCMKAVDTVRSSDSDAV